METYTERVNEVENENDSTSSDVEEFKAKVRALMTEMAEEILQLRHRVSELEDRVHRDSQDSVCPNCRDNPV